MILQKEHKEALLHYIDTFPSRWKSEIRKDWDSALFCTPYLRAIRNQYGLKASRLDKTGSKPHDVTG